MCVSILSGGDSAPAGRPGILGERPPRVNITINMIVTSNSIIVVITDIIMITTITIIGSININLVPHRRGAGEEDVVHLSATSSSVQSYIYIYIYIYI